MSRKYKKICKTLNFIELFLILVSKIVGRISISALSSLLGVPEGITRSAIVLKICAVAAGIKNYKLLIKKKKKKHVKIRLLAKSKLNNIEFLFTRAISIQSSVMMNLF